MANFLTNLLSSFGKKEGESVLGIDIGSASIKVVQMHKKKGRAVLETYGEIALGPYVGQALGQATNPSTDKVAEAIVDLLREANATTKNCGLSLPISASLITFMKMPNVDERQLDTMVPIEARKYVPVSPSEVSINYWVIPKEETAFSEFQAGQTAGPDKSLDILLVAVHNDSIIRNQDIVKAAGITSTFSEIELFGSIRSVVEQSLSPQMIIDFGASKTKLYIVERGILRASHVISRGSQDITMAISKSLELSFIEAEEIKKKQGLTGNVKDQNLREIASITLEYIFSEIRRVLLNYQKKYEKNIGNIYLSGGGSELKGLKEMTESSLMAPVLMANPFAKVEYPAFIEGTLREVGPEFSVAVGLALRKLQEVN